MQAEFSASFLQSSVSHDPSEIIIICLFASQETFILIKYNYFATFSLFDFWSI